MVRKIVMPWDRFAKDTIGKQLVRAADSIGANIAEGVGRYGLADTRRFILIARGSHYETQHWLRRAYRRKLLGADHVQLLKTMMDELSPKFGAYLRSLTQKLPPKS